MHAPSTGGTLPDKPISSCSMSSINTPLTCCNATNSSMPLCRLISTTTIIINTDGKLLAEIFKFGAEWGEVMWRKDLSTLVVASGTCSNKYEHDQNI